MTAQTPISGYLAPEQRGEWVDTRTGKLYHRPPGSNPDLDTPHVGSWLTCDACNPVQVVRADPSYKPQQMEPEVLLAELRAEFAEAKAEADAAAERLKAVKGKLQTALSEATNGALRSALHVPGYRPLTLTYGERWTVDTPRLKAEQPVTYAAYAKLGSNWTLAESKGQ